MNIALAMAASLALSAAGHNPVANPEAVVTQGVVRFTVLTPEMIRIEYSPSKEFEANCNFFHRISFCTFCFRLFNLSLQRMDMW